MAIPFLNNISLSDNELQNAKLHITGTAPTAAPGQIYYSSQSDTARYHDSTGWVNIQEIAPSNTSFINLAKGTGAKPSFTASLSASGTPNGTTYLRGDNTWSPISGITGTTYDLDSTQAGAAVIVSLVGSNSTLDSITLVPGSNMFLTDDGSNNITIDSVNAPITLFGDVTGSGTGTIITTISPGSVEFPMMSPSAIITSSEGITNNNNDTTIPTSAAVKAYADSLIVGGLIYQGGYNAATNTPDLDSSPSAAIKKGWTYTVTADGLFFTEQVRVGDVLIAEEDAPSGISDWTTVQNNVDIASSTQIGIGNVNVEGLGEGDGLRLSYNAGTATLGLDIDTLTTTGYKPNLDEIFIPIYEDGYGNNHKISVETLSEYVNDSGTFAGTVTTAVSQVNHNLNTRDVIVQLYDTVTNETVYADIDRNSANSVRIVFSTAPSSPIRVLVQKIG